MQRCSYNVLIVDDRQEEHELYAAFLRKDPESEYTLFHAFDGKQGVKMYHENNIDCILLDNNMPGMSGIDVLKQLANENQPVPAVMLTGEGNEAIAVTAMKLGSQDYIPKRAITAAALKRTIANTAERTLMQKQINEAHEALARSNRDLEQFATIAAHDLKAPLRAVIQHLTLVEQNNRSRLDTDSQASITFAVNGATRMRQLIDGLFDYAKFGFNESACAPVDCNAQFEIAVKILECDIREKKASVTRTDLPPVQGDGIQIQQLLQNLIGNALKYCSTSPCIHISARRDENMWQFAVKDNGIGLAPENREKIFLIFRRLHRPGEYHGAGVGLAICDRVVKNHHGRIWVESTPGEGSTFFFTLPEAEPVQTVLAVNG